MVGKKANRRAVKELRREERWVRETAPSLRKLHAGDRRAIARIDEQERTSRENIARLRDEVG